MRETAKDKVAAIIRELAEIGARCAALANHDCSLAVVQCPGDNGAPRTATTTSTLATNSSN
jgi:hypothetical protein